MNKLKKIWRRLKMFVKKHYLILAGSFGFVLLLMMFLPVFRSSWLDYPEILRAKIAIKKLAATSETSFYCRDDCATKRLLYKNIISKILLTEKEKLLPDLERVIISPQVLPEIRILMVKIWRESGQEPSLKLKEFYNDPKNSLSLRAELARAWPELVDISFYGEIIGNFKTASTDSEKENLLNLLIGKNEQIVIKFIWDIILGDYSFDLKNKAFFLLANIENKQLSYQASDLDKLRSVLESGDYPHRVKDQAILVLSDYYSFYPEPSEALLVDVINRIKYFDDFQRSFAIDIINRYRTLKISSPELSQADWDAYFTN